MIIKKKRGRKKEGGRENRRGEGEGMEGEEGGEAMEEEGGERGRRGICGKY